jgi:hypothetical protein
VLTAQPAHAGDVRRPVERASLLALAFDGASPYTWYLGADGVPYRCADDARTVREAYWPGAGPLAAELRYSRRCRTAWARSSVSVNAIVNSYYLDGRFRTFAFQGKDPTADPLAKHFTAMLNDAGLLAEACVSYGSGYDTICTGRY